MRFRFNRFRVVMAPSVVTKRKLVEEMPNETHMRILMSR